MRAESNWNYAEFLWVRGRSEIGWRLRRIAWLSGAKKAENKNSNFRGSEARGEARRWRRTSEEPDALRRLKDEKRAGERERNRKKRSRGRREGDRRDSNPRKHEKKEPTSSPLLDIPRTSWNAFLFSFCFVSVLSNLIYTHGAEERTNHTWQSFWTTQTCFVPFFRNGKSSNFFIH